MKSFFAGKRSDSKQTSMQSTHMQAHTDSNTTKQTNETSTDQHANRCMRMQTLTECSALQLCVTATAVTDHLVFRDRRVIYRCTAGSRRMIMMIGRASFIGLIPRRWITIAATQWQFLATCCTRVSSLTGNPSAKQLSRRSKTSLHLTGPDTL